MKEFVTIAQCDICGMKYAGISDEKQVVNSGVYPVDITFRSSCADIFKDITFGDVCVKCREKILADFIALGEKYTKRKSVNGND